MTLERAAGAPGDVLAGVRATFGPELAAVFAWDHPGQTGRFAIAGREIQLRDVRAEPADHPWQARLPGIHCECGGGLWAMVTGPADMLDVYEGARPDDAACDRCDTLIAG